MTNKRPPQLIAFSIILAGILLARTPAMAHVIPTCGIRSQERPSHVRLRPLDSLPPLHSLREDDITSVTPSDEDETIQVTLRTGDTLTYYHIDWDLEDQYPSTAMELKETIRHLERTFIKVATPPQFAGGDKEWDRYLNDFCLKHSREIKENGPADIRVQFIVHMKGEVAGLSVLSDGGHPELTGLAMQAIRDSPLWRPAFRDGNKVVCYKVQHVILSL
jgi:hypothetical protein